MPFQFINVLMFYCQRHIPSLYFVDVLQSGMYLLPKGMYPSILLIYLMFYNHRHILFQEGCVNIIQPETYPIKNKKFSGFLACVHLRDNSPLNACTLLFGRQHLRELNGSGVTQMLDLYLSDYHPMTSMKTISLIEAPGGC